MIDIRTSAGQTFRIEANPARPLTDLSIELQHMMNIVEPLEFYLRGEVVPITSLVGDINLGPEDYLTVRTRRVPRAQASAPARRARRRLPARDGVARREDPPDFYRKVELLMDLGDFSREQCEKALRDSFYNTDRATRFLIADPTQGREERTQDGQITGEEMAVLREIADEAGIAQTPKYLGTIYQVWKVNDGNRDATLLTLRDETFTLE
jgi:hypothetical protein